MSASITNTSYLPPCVLKEELATYFGVTLEWMWSDVITDDLLEDWGYDWSTIKRKHRLPFQLTRKIYLHFWITDLRQPYSVQIEKEIQALGESSPG